MRWFGWRVRLMLTTASTRPFESELYTTLLHREASPAGVAEVNRALATGTAAELVV
jgi:hypothetical protein